VSATGQPTGASPFDRGVSAIRRVAISHRRPQLRTVSTSISILISLLTRRPPASSAMFPGDAEVVSIDRRHCGEDEAVAAPRIASAILVRHRQGMFWVTPWIFRSREPFRPNRSTALGAERRLRVGGHIEQFPLSALGPPRENVRRVATPLIALAYPTPAREGVAASGVCRGGRSGADSAATGSRWWLVNDCESLRPHRQAL